MKFLFFFLIFSTQLWADPWGKDADLVQFKRSDEICEIKQANPSLLARLGGKAIRFHQEVISPADGPRSHFIPSSSQYTLDAMNKYGFFQGYVMGCDRLLRENEEEWVYKRIRVPAGYLMKWDPVP